MGFYSSRYQGNEGKGLAFTSMIDVVFLLLIYFLVVAEPVDVFAELEVNRPMGQSENVSGTLPLKITLNDDGINIAGRDFTAHSMREALIRLSKLDANQSVLIACADEAKHKNLVEVLDACAESGLTQISLVGLKNKDVK